jgi:hypothetical protein
MTRVYKFNDRSFYRSSLNNKVFNRSSLASTNIKIVLMILALIILAVTYDLTMLEVVSESAKFM